MEERPQTNLSNQVKTNEDGKIIAIISYLSVIGWIIAYVMYGNNKTPLGAYHLRQTIALFVVGIATWIAQTFLMLIPVIGWLIGILLVFVYLLLLVLWLYGFVAAINGQEKPMPLIGIKAQEWFKGLK